MKKWATKINGKIVRHGAKGFSIGQPGTDKWKSYCKRSGGIAKKFPNARKEDSPNTLSRKKWRCGSYGLALLFFLLIGISMVSAMEIDNVKSYDSNLKEATISNSFLGFATSDIAKATLITPQINYVMPGKDRKVAEFEVDLLSDEYKGAFDNMEFYNNFDGKRIQRIFTYKYKSYEDNYVDVPDKTEQVCEDVYINSKDKQKSCYTITLTWKKENQPKEVWIPLDKLDLTKGKITIGIFTDVYSGDNVEWIPTIFGVKIEEWATWTSGLNTGLVSYWNMESANDSLGINNGTLTGNAAPGAGGIIGNGLILDGNGDYLNIAGPYNQYSNATINGTRPFSISLWIKAANFTSQNGIIGNPDSGPNVGWAIRLPSTAANIDLIKYSVEAQSQAFTSRLSNNIWYHIVAIQEPTQVQYFLNGVNFANNTASGAILKSGQPLWIGSTQASDNQAFNGTIDEVGIWNRSLTASEVVQLYNGGSGISYTTTFTPIVTSNAPADSTTSSSGVVNYNCSAEAVTPYTLINISLMDNSTGTWKINQTQARVGTTNQSIFSVTYSGSANSFIWACRACQSDGLCGIATNRTLTFNPYASTINAVEYETTAYETSSTRYVANISFGPLVLSASAKLWYNGTSYDSTAISLGGNNYSFTNTLDIPLTSIELSQKSFFWQVTAFDGASSYISNTSTYNQNVSKIHLEKCGGSYNTTFINFTAIDEDTLARVRDFSFQGTFNFWLGDGSTNRTYSVDDTSINETALCFSPADKTVITDASIEYGDNNETYVTKDYNLNEYSATNITSNISLYMLKASDSTTFILKVQDTAQNPEADVYIHIQRYFPGTNTYQTVQIAKTNDDGKTVGFYKVETVNYRHLLYDADGTLLLQTSPGKVFAESVPYTIVFTIGESPEIPWEDLETLTELSSSIGYNNNTKIANFTYIDTSSTFTSSRFLVEKIWMNQSNQVICNTTSSLASAVITCNVASYNGSMIGYGFITRGGIETLVEINTWNVGSTSKQTFDKTGLFLAWFIMLVAASIFLYNFIVGMWIECAAIVLVNLIGLASFPLVFIWGAIALTIITTVVLGKEGGNV